MFLNQKQKNGDIELSTCTNLWSKIEKKSLDTYEPVSGENNDNMYGNYINYHTSIMMQLISTIRPNKTRGPEGPEALT